MPGIRMVDAAIVGLEWIEGNSVKPLLPGSAVEDEDESKGGEEEEDALSEWCDHG